MWFESGLVVVMRLEWTVRQLIVVVGAVRLSSFSHVLDTQLDSATSGDFPTSSTTTAEVLTI